MRDYVTAWAVYARDPATGLLTGFDFAATEEDAKIGASQWSPPDQQVGIIKCWVKFAPKTELLGILNGARALGLYDNPFVEFDKSPRASGYNSETEKPQKKA